MEGSFHKRILRISLPILIQGVISYLLLFIDMLMVSNLGSVAISAVSISAQIIFVMRFIVFSFAESASIFIVRSWGKRNYEEIKVVTGLSISSTLVGLVVFVPILVIFSRFFLGIFINDNEVITAAIYYFRLILMSFITYAISNNFVTVFRSTGNTIIPMISGLLSLGINTLLNYIFIFGYLRFPEMGIYGAGLATVLSRVIELCFLLIMSYKINIINRIKMIISINKFSFIFKEYFGYYFIISAKQILWVLSTSVFNILYARIGTDSFAMYNIALSVEKILLIIFSALALGAFNIVGYELGKNRYISANKFAKKNIFLTIGLAGIISLFLSIFVRKLTSIYSISDSLRLQLESILLVIFAIIPFKALNILVSDGILKARKDVIFPMIIESVMGWLIGIPLVYICIYFYELPITVTLLAIGGLEFVKAIVYNIRNQNLGVKSLENNSEKIIGFVDA